MTSVVVKPADMGKHRLPQEKTRPSRMIHVDGLRGFAISLVVIFHVFVGKVSSGVDVFLFLGGLLFLTSQMKNASSPTGISFGQSIIRIIRRLAPALIVVTSVTTILMLITYPVGAWRNNLIDASAAVGYWVNWRLGITGSTYAAASADVSIYQHIWSMSVQLQIYLAIMALVYAVMTFAYSKNRDYEHAKKIILGIVILLTVASFVYAMYMMGNQQTLNYFSTFSRFWEIGIGALFGAAMMEMVFSKNVRIIFSIVGLVLIVGTGIIIDGNNQFPGPMALIPIVGAMMIVSSGLVYSLDGRGFSSIGVTHLLETGPMLFLGKIAYSLYLWHWPVLIIAVNATGLESYNPLVGIPVIAVSLGLAWLTWKYVETPLQQKGKPEKENPFTIQYVRNSIDWARNKTLFPAAISLITVAALVSMSPFIYIGGNAIKQSRDSSRVAAAGGFDASYPGAFAMLTDEEAVEDVPIMPDPANLSDMMPMTQDDGCYTEFGSGELVLEDNDGNPCAYGDVDSDRELYLVGGSHSEQYIGALDTIGKERGIKIVPVLKMGCPLYQDFRWDGADFPECYEEWSPQAEQYIIDNPPSEGVFMISSRMSSVQGDGPEVVPSVYVDAFNRIADSGIQVFAVRDNPWFMREPGIQKDVRLCVSEGDIESCGQSTEGMLARVNPAEVEFGRNPNIKVVDFTNMLVIDRWAPAVIGNVLVYRDSHHLTRQFVDTMTPEIDRILFED